MSDNEDDMISFIEKRVGHDLTREEIYAVLNAELEYLITNVSETE